MTEPTPLTLYMGHEYLVTLAQSPPDEPPGARMPVAWSQNDRRWQMLEYAPGYTFAQAGCLVCSVAMLISMAYAAAPTPVEVAERLHVVGAFDGGLLTRPARINAAYERMVWGGYLHWRSVPADLAVVAREVADYGATIIEVVWNPKSPISPQNGNQHFVVAVGVHGGSRPDVQIIDPWDGTEKALTQSAYALPAGWSAARAVHGVRLVRYAN